MVCDGRRSQPVFRLALSAISLCLDLGFVHSTCAEYILLTALFGAGAILSHPETGLHTAAACALIWLFKGRSSRGLRDASFVALGVLLFTSPWWGTVLFQHGFASFQSALSTGGHSLLFWLPWVTFDFAEERFATILTVLGLIGFAVQCARRDWFLPLWVLMPLLSNRAVPRQLRRFRSWLAGIGLSDLIIPGIAALDLKSRNEPHEWIEYLSRGRVAKIVLSYVLFFALIGAVIYDFSLTNYVVSAMIALPWSGSLTTRPLRVGLLFCQVELIRWKIR